MPAPLLTTPELTFTEAGVGEVIRYWKSTNGLPYQVLPGELGVIAHTDTRPVAWCCYTTMEEDGAPDGQAGECVWVWSLFVTPGFRRHGVGHAVIAELRRRHNMPVRGKGVDKRGSMTRMLD